MASDDSIKTMNDIFKDMYASKITDLLPTGLGKLSSFDYSTTSKRTLEYRVNRYNDEKAKKELEKRELPLWKAMNE